VIYRNSALSVVLLLAPFLAPAQDDPPAYLLINNVTALDGTSDTATPGMNVLVENNVISRSAPTPT